MYRREYVFDPLLLNVATVSDEKLTIIHAPPFRHVKVPRAPKDQQDLFNIYQSFRVRQNDTRKMISFSRAPIVRKVPKFQPHRYHQCTFAFPAWSIVHGSMTIWKHTKLMCRRSLLSLSRRLIPSWCDDVWKLLVNNQDTSLAFFSSSFLKEQDVGTGLIAVVSFMMQITWTRVNA